MKGILCDCFAMIRHEHIPDLSLGHHVFIRLQVEGKGFPHLSDTVEEHLHLHHMLLIPLFELNVWTHKHTRGKNVITCLYNTQ